MPTQTTATSFKRRRRPSIASFAFRVLVVAQISSAFQPVVAHKKHELSLSASTAIPPNGLSPYYVPQEDASFWPPFANNKKQNLLKNEYIAAKDTWAKKYCSVSGLRESFGKNRNWWWGDLDVTTTRRLYKCLMPVALMELYDTGHVDPHDLAKLAYRARRAAKLYARERCIVPGRMAANLFDGYRQWRKYGSFDMAGMSFQQVWEKYADSIAMDEDEESDEVAHKICLKILERSCASNEMIDNLVLTKKSAPTNIQDLESVERQLEEDVRELLQHDHFRVTTFKALRAVARLRRRIAAIQRQFGTV